MPFEAIHPLVFFWIAFYKDGTCLPQFDIETGKENAFVDIDQTKLDKFGLFPFTSDLVVKANAARGDIVARKAENLSFFILKLEETQRVINVRRNFINMFSYSKCFKCGFEWQWMRTFKAGTIGDAGLPIYPDCVKEKINGQDRDIVQCPKCKTFNSGFCSECGTQLILKERGRTATVPPRIDLYHFCTKCDKERLWLIKTSEDTRRQLTYIIGYQITVDGKNVKQLMFIKEDGTISLKNDL